jgi:hypothetical protein
VEPRRNPSPIGLFSYYVRVFVGIPPVRTFLTLFSFLYIKHLKHIQQLFKILELFDSRTKPNTLKSWIGYVIVLNVQMSWKSVLYRTVPILYITIHKSTWNSTPKFQGPSFKMRLLDRHVQKFHNRVLRKFLKLEGRGKLGTDVPKKISQANYAHEEKKYSRNTR